MRILLVGGGTFGSVMPLLAMVEELETTTEVEFFWLGTKKGPEKELVTQNQIPFKTIWAAKWPRYFSFFKILTPFILVLAFFQALFILKNYKPNIILSAGSFIAVPVVWAAALFKIPCCLHQQDVQVGLANKLMLPLASLVTTTLRESVFHFQNLLNRPLMKTIKRYKKRPEIVWTGNAIRPELKSGQISFLEKKEGLPLVLILGGGTGALKLNRIVVESLPTLIQFCQIIHITGKNKMIKKEDTNYRAYEFIIETKGLVSFYQAADLVITRAGMSTLSELAYLDKAIIIIPLPDTHQESNAQYFLEHKAAVVLKQKGLTVNGFVHSIKEILEDKRKREELSQNISQIMPKNGTEKIAAEVAEYLKAASNLSS